MTTENNTQPKHVKAPKLMLVRYGRLGQVGWFEHDEAQLPKVHTKVLIKTERGLELGEIVGQFCYKAGNFRMTPENVDKYFRDGGEEHSPQKAGEFVRFASMQDVNEDKHLRRDGKREMEAAIRIAKEHNVPIDIVDVEHIFGGERIIFYFVAETRVDFRDLVRLLAKEYQTRIEMRQIGSRDEAKLMSDYENCGQQCCCGRFMQMLKPVNMRMAKLQKATLDPSKISGYCGRLKCCLRFEDDTYRDLRESLPKRGTRVKTPEGIGTVIDTHILAQLVMIYTDDGRRIAVPLEQVEPSDVPEPVRDEQGRTEQQGQRHQGGERRGGRPERPERPERPDRHQHPLRDEAGPEIADDTVEDIAGDIEARYEEDRDGDMREIVEEIADTGEEGLVEEPQRPEQPVKPAIKWAPVGPNRDQGRGARDEGRETRDQRPGAGGQGRRNRGQGSGAGDQGRREDGGQQQRDRNQRPQGGQGGQQGGQQRDRNQGPQGGQGEQQGGQPGQGGPGQEGGGRRRRNRRRNRHRGQGGQPGQPGQQGGPANGPQGGGPGDGGGSGGPGEHGPQ